jgi:hypothetical protein
MFDAGTEADADEGNGIESAPCSEREFLFPSERGGVKNIACIEVWDDADQTLRVIFAINPHMLLASCEPVRTGVSAAAPRYSKNVRQSICTL